MSNSLILDSLRKLQLRSKDLTAELNGRLTELYKWYYGQMNAVSDELVALLNNPEHTYKPKFDLMALATSETTDTYVKYPETDGDVELSLQNLSINDRVINIENADFGTRNWPDFWLCALLGCKTTRRWVSEEDFEPLHHLNELRVNVFESNEVAESFEICFHFTENQFFSNSRLWRRFNLSKDDVVSESSSVSWTNCELPDSYQGFFKFFDSEIEYDDLKMGMCIKDRIWRDPLKYVMRYQGQLEGEPAESDSEDDFLENNQVGSRYPFSWLFS